MDYQVVVDKIKSNDLNPKQTQTLVDVLDHGMRVSLLVEKVCSYAGFDKQRTERLSEAAFFHDIGKVLVDQQVLNAPRRLSTSEKNIIDEHVRFSTTLLKEFVSRDVLELVASHHMRKYFKSGIWPDIEILIACDIYDALTSCRVYRNRPLSYEDAFHILKEENIGDEILAMLGKAILELKGINVLEYASW